MYPRNTRSDEYLQSVLVHPLCWICGNPAAHAAVYAFGSAYATTIMIWSSYVYHNHGNKHRPHSSSDNTWDSEYKHSTIESWPKINNTSPRANPANIPWSKINHRTNTSIEKLVTDPHAHKYNDAFLQAKTGFLDNRKRLQWKVRKLKQRKIRFILRSPKEVL
jgi:hypothetical protein